MPVLLGLGAAAAIAPALVGPASAAGASAPTTASPYYGRWTVAEEEPVFTTRGRLYKTIDVSPCGKNFCGVSVDDTGKCGTTLFRFAGKSAKGVDELRGRGKWGQAQKNVVIYASQEADAPSERYFCLLYTSRCV